MAADAWSPVLSGQCSANNLGLQNFPMCCPSPVHIYVPFFVTIRLHLKVFLLWESQIVNLIESQGFIRFIDGTIPSPSPSVVINDQFVPNLTFLLDKGLIN